MTKPSFDELARYGTAGCERRRRTLAWSLGLAATPVATGLVTVALTAVAAKTFGLLPASWPWWGVLSLSGSLLLAAYGAGRWIDRQVRPVR